MSYSNKNRSNSNLERFLDCTTPSIPAQFLQKDCFNENRLWGPFDDGSSHYFKLGDLWNCYDEWSAYGAGVPILLNCKETVVQYYVPYLSALQIYTSSSSNRSISDGECCDYDLRDCSLNGGSETSSEDCESSTANLSDERLPSFRSCNYSEKSVSWDGSGFEECGGGGGGGVGVEQEHWWRPQDRLGYLYLEYFENSSPYARVPLMEKINQLSRGYPELHSLGSIDLSPASWMSVAWYPIYHIPTSRSVKDLSASFLTYHTLSFSFQDNDNVMVNGDGNKDWAENIRLPPFGAATYKLHGNVWFSGGGEDHQRLYSLWSAALSWLNQLHLQHPDFRFFLGHRN